MKIKENMDKKLEKNTIKNRLKYIFYKTNPCGISLIVLVITIIVIIILATAIILTLNKNNPISEANKARFESDRDSMQSVFTNTVAKVMAKNQSSINIKEGQINNVVEGVNETIGEVIYELENPEKSENKNGKIIFDNNENTEVEYYTGRKLPIYSSGKTIWSVDSEGILKLQIGDEKYEEDKKEPIEEEIKIGKEEYDNLISRIESLEEKSNELEKRTVNIQRVNLLDRHVDTLISNAERNYNVDVSLKDAIDKYKYLEFNLELVSTDYVQNKFQKVELVSVEKIKYNNTNTKNMNDSSTISLNINSINMYRILVWFKNNKTLHIGLSQTVTGNSHYFRIKSIYGIN